MLLLFDIDGTLLHKAAREHAAAMYAAMAEVYDAVDLDGGGIALAGRTDIEIARLVLLRAGLSADHIDAGLPEFRAATCDHYARLAPASLVANVVPGIAAVLERLIARAEVKLALVTGNLEPIARLKLARAGLGRFFPAGQGGFGSDSEDRTDLPPIARLRAGTRRQPYARGRTLVIGDTPRDIACARADGLRCVAVTSGPYGAAELAGADRIAADSGELGELLEAEIATHA